MSGAHQYACHSAASRTCRPSEEERKRGLNGTEHAPSDTGTHARNMRTDIPRKERPADAPTEERPPLAGYTDIACIDENRG